MKLGYGVLGAVLVSILALAVIFGSSDAATVSAASPPNATHVSQQYGSIDEAQAVVPFRIHQVVVPDTFHFAGATVLTEHALRTGVVTRVTLMYTSTEHDMITLEESTADSHISIPDESINAVAVGGAAAQAITGHNLAGMSMGIVHWETQGLYFTIVATHSDGSTVAQLAQTVN